MPSRGVVHYGDNMKPACRNQPFTYFAWATRDKKEVTCKHCLKKLAKRSA